MFFEYEGYICVLVYCLYSIVQCQYINNSNIGGVYVSMKVFVIKVQGIYIFEFGGKFEGDIGGVVNEFVFIGQIDWIVLFKVFYTLQEFVRGDVYVSNGRRLIQKLKIIYSKYLRI